MRTSFPVTVVLFAALVALVCSDPASARGGGKKDGGGKGAAGGAGPGGEEKRYAVGDTVKDLALDLAGGGTWTEASVAGKHAVLVFAVAASSESLDALRTLGKSDGAVATSGSAVLGILRDVGAEEAADTAKKEKITVAVAADPKRRAYDRFARSGLPFTVVLDPKGKILHAAAGFDDAAVAKIVTKKR
jgi:peroxiredoxin